MDGLINHDSQPERSELELVKERVARFFIDSSHDKNKILIVPGDNPETIKIKVDIDTDTRNQPESFSFQIDGGASLERFRKTPQDDLCDRLNFSDINFLVNGKTIKLSEICPIGTKFIMEENGHPYYWDDTIFMGQLLADDDFVKLLHEIGHSIDEAKDFSIEERRSRGWAKRERGAWTEALKIVKKYDLPIRERVRKTAQAQLESYDAGVRRDRHGEELGASNESRKKLRNKKQ